MSAVDPRPSLYLVDDEERILRSLALLFRNGYQVRSSTDPREALEQLRLEPADVIVSDQRMPHLNGASFLREVRSFAPHSMRILLTGYSELEAVVASVNEGEIFRFVNKPWDARELRATVDQAAQIARALKTRGEAPAASATAGEVVLVIDDDPEVAREVTALLAGQARVLSAPSLEAALPVIAREPVAVVVSELAVGGASVTGFLKWLKAEHPEIVSIVLTPFQDVQVFIGLINQGQVFRLLPKPVRRGPLGMSLGTALKRHRALREAPQQRLAHVVEPIREAEERGLADRVMGLWGRLRGRPASGT